MPSTNKPKILFFDIETIPHILAGFTIQGKQSISHKQIMKYGEILCISWAWGDGKVQHATFDIGKYDWYEKRGVADKKLVMDFCNMAQDADLVVGQNIKDFDVAMLRQRLVYYKLPDFRPLLIDDTYKSTTQKDSSLRFPTHKLDGLADYLGYGGKADHGDGYEWWIEIMRGNKEVLKKMVYYCDVDVEKTRTIYKHIKPYIKSNLNMAMFFDRPDACPSCGQDERPLIIRRYDVRRRPVFQCPVCQAYPFTRGSHKLSKPIKNYMK